MNKKSETKTKICETHHVKSRTNPELINKRQNICSSRRDLCQSKHHVNDQTLTEFQVLKMKGKKKKKAHTKSKKTHKHGKQDTDNIDNLQSIFKTYLDNQIETFAEGFKTILRPNVDKTIETIPEERLPAVELKEMFGKTKEYDVINKLDAIQIWEEWKNNLELSTPEPNKIEHISDHKISKYEIISKESRPSVEIKEIFNKRKEEEEDTVDNPTLTVVTKLTRILDRIEKVLSEEYSDYVNLQSNMQLIS